MQVKIATCEFDDSTRLTESSSCQANCEKHVIVKEVIAAAAATILRQDMTLVRDEFVWCESDS
jgi:hypothetical protein